jgi:hypothetical protein
MMVASEVLLSLWRCANGASTRLDLRRMSITYTQCFHNRWYCPSQYERNQETGEKYRKGRNERPWSELNYGYL